MASLRAVHPVIEVEDVDVAVGWYCQAMAFDVAFDDGDDPPGYVGLRRNGVMVHLQSHLEDGWAEGGRCIYRSSTETTEPPGANSVLPSVVEGSQGDHDGEHSNVDL